MSLFSLLPLMAAPDAGGAAPGPASMLTTFIPFALIIGIFYFLIIRPQNKKQKETQRMLAALKKGDKIVTIGGIMGVIQSVDADSVVVKVDDGCKIRFIRSAVNTVRDESKGDSKTETAKVEEKKGEEAPALEESPAAEAVERKDE